LSKDDQPKDHR